MRKVNVRDLKSKGEFFNQMIIIIGGGPSHSEINLDLLFDYRFITVNSSCRRMQDLATKEDVLYFSDNNWSERFFELIENWPGRVITGNKNVKIRLDSLVDYIDLKVLARFMNMESDIFWASSGHVAACLAAFLGSKRIILIGFECGEVNNQTHGHDDYRMENLNSFENIYIPGWKNLAQRFRDLEVEVINSTPNSKIMDFPFISLDKVLAYA